MPRARKAHDHDERMAKDTPANEHSAPPHSLPDALSERARAAGIDPATFAALMESLPRSDRAQLRDLCRDDLSRASGDLRRAIRRWDRPAIRRQLHLMISLGGTLGARRLGREAQRMQDLIMAGETAQLDASARLIETQLSDICGFLGTLRFDDEGRPE